MYSITQLQNLLSLHGFPAQYLWVIPIALVVAGVFFVFSGRLAWKVAIGGGGAAAGYIIAERYIAHYLISILPAYASEAILAVIIGVILAVVIRFAIAGGIGYMGYYIALHQTLYHVPFYGLIVAGVVAFGIAYWLYGKISIIIAAFLGALSLFYGLSFYVKPEYAATVAVILLAVGLYYQVSLRKELKKQAAMAEDKLERKKLRLKAKTALNEKKKAFKKEQKAKKIAKKESEKHENPS